MESPNNFNYPAAGVVVAAALCSPADNQIAKQLNTSMYRDGLTSFTSFDEFSSQLQSNLNSVLSPLNKINMLVRETSSYNDAMSNSPMEPVAFKIYSKGDYIAATLNRQELQQEQLLKNMLSDDPSFSWTAFKDF